MHAVSPRGRWDIRKSFIEQHLKIGHEDHVDMVREIKNYLAGKAQKVKSQAIHNIHN